MTLTMEQKYEACKAGTMDINDFLSDNERFLANLIRNRVTITSKVGYMGVTYEDFFQVGQIGLWKAYMSYKPETGWKWYTYATACVMTEVNTLIKFSTRKQRFSTEVRSLDYKAPFHRPTVSAEDTLSYADYFPIDEKGYSEVEETLDRPVRMKMFLSSLKASERRIYEVAVQHPDKLMSDIADMLGCSQSWVSRQLKAMNKKYLEICEKDVAV